MPRLRSGLDGDQRRSITVGQDVGGDGAERGKPDAACKECDRHQSRFDSMHTDYMRRLRNTIYLPSMRSATAFRTCTSRVFLVMIPWT